MINRLQQKLDQREAAGNLRKLSKEDLPIDFYSNDYLGFASDPQLSFLIHEEFEKVKDPKRLNGSTGSRLLSGNDQYFDDTEAFLADVLKAETALLFNSGYNANLALLSSIPQKGDTIIYDELIHASLKDGARLSFAKRFSFRHNDVEDLRSKINKSEGTVFVVVESVYSMDGDFSPLQEITQVTSEAGAFLIVDEAHSTGLWGKSGEGLVCQLGLEKDVFARVHTFGKAMGVHGACICGSQVIKNYLINFARPFIYTTSLPLHSLASIKASFQYLNQNKNHISALLNNITFFKQLKENIPDFRNHWINSSSPIQAIKFSGNKEVKQVSAAFRKEGIDMRPILSPTVKEGEERLRICLHSFNPIAEIELLFKVLQHCNISGVDHSGTSLIKP